MYPVRLPRGCSVFEERGSWKLRWNEDELGKGDRSRASSWKLRRIGSATGPKALSESDARRLARKYLLCNLPAGVNAAGSQITIADFVKSRFLPEFVASKTLSAQGHFHTILKHVVSPEEAHGLLEVRINNPTEGEGLRRGWPYLNSLRLRDVRPDHVQQLISTALDTGYSIQTVRHIRSVVSALFSYAKQEMLYVGPNPARSVKLPESHLKDSSPLTCDQLKQVLWAMRYPEKEMAMFALLTDMNACEICGLQWKGINLTGALLSSQGEMIPAITIAVVKRWYRGKLTDVKEARRRMIRIPEVLLPMLLMLRSRPRFTRPDDFVLASRSGSAINVTNITARRLSSIARNLGIKELTWLMLRRVQASLKEVHGLQFQYELFGAPVSELPEGRSPRETSKKQRRSEPGCEI